MAKKLEEWLETDVKKLTQIPVGELSNTFFFRDPLRPNFIDNEHFYSPADGTILYQKFVQPNESVVEIKGMNYTLKDVMGDDEYNKPSLVIGIFMSFYDPHIIRIPYKGVINFEHMDCIESTNIPMLAVEKDILNKVINPNNLGYLKNNERMKIEVYSSLLNYKYHMYLIADEDVNVIAPFKKQQELCMQNERFGLVRWGSQTELILPLDERFEFELCQEDHTHIEAGLDPLVKIKNK
jgi:phosphatidylserine decarboxylase